MKVIYGYFVFYSHFTSTLFSGVRYLEKAVFNLDYGQLKLVFHALRERKQVIENAPHLCQALPCMTPCFEWFEAVYYWMGLKLYDLVAGRRMLHLSRYYSANESVELFPTLSRKGHNGSLKGTVVYYDGQMNDSRLNVGLACSAALVGATVLNHAEVISLIKDDFGDRIIGARIRDQLSGNTKQTLVLFFPSLKVVNVGLDHHLISFFFFPTFISVSIICLSNLVLIFFIIKIMVLKCSLYVTFI